VRHRRFAPVSNEFTYRLFMMYLDLAELSEVFRGRLLWSTKRPNLACLRRRDHLGNPGMSGLLRPARNDERTSGALEALPVPQDISRFALHRYERRVRLALPHAR